jgi:hypothetical protein
MLSASICPAHHLESLQVVRETRSVLDSEGILSTMYYAGLRNRADALVINLETDEKRDDIDFTISSQ